MNTDALSGLLVLIMVVLFYIEMQRGESARRATRKLQITALMSAQRQQTRNSLPHRTASRSRS